MKISINHLTLDNFKGVSTSMIDFGSENANIYGANATGKTTHFDAFLWVLFGKDSLNNANFEIKALDEAGTQAHNLEHSVELSLNIDGVTLALKKTYAEKWTRKRGQAAPEFTGHTSTYFIDQVPSKKKEYDEKISSIIDESAFRLLADPRYFNEQLHWQKRRELLLEVCGEVEDQAVIDSVDNLSALPEILDGKSIEDHKKIVVAKRKAVNDELAKIPTRIDEVKKSIVEIPQEKSIVEKVKAGLEKEKSELETKLSDLKNGGEAAKLRIELQEVVAEIRKVENDFSANQDARIKKERLACDESMANLEAHNREITAHDSETAQIQVDSASSTKKIKDLRGQWHKINSEEFSHTGKCPTCGQDIPVEEIQEAEAVFNNSKATKLKEISAAGKLEGDRLEASQSHIEGRKKIRAKLTQDRDYLLLAIKDYGTTISKIRNETADTEELSKKAAEIEDKLLNAQGNSKEAIITLESEIKIKNEEIQAQVDILNQIKANGKAESRQVELMAQEKKLVEEFGRLEYELNLLEQFTREKVALLESKINSKFEIARFKLFSDQINGGLTETCETVLDGVPYGSINSAGRVQVGMDTIKTLQAHYGVSAPIWIDNRESIIDLPEIDAQVISLIVNKKDPVLRVETITKKERRVA